MPPLKTSRLQTVFLLFFCLISVSGCTMFGGGNNTVKRSEEIGQKEGQSYTVQHLQDDILKFASRFDAYVRSTSNKIYTATDSSKMKKRTLLWKIRLVPAVHEIASGTKPRADFLALAYITRTMKLYLTIGDGKEIFADHQSIAVETASELDQMVLEIGEEFLNPEQMRKLRKDIQAYAEKNPIRGPDFSLELARKSIQKIDKSNEFNWISDVPLIPFRAMSGISAMPSAIRDLSKTVWVTSHTMKHLPRLARWQTELLLYDLENREAVQDISMGIKNMDETSRKTGERLELSGKSIINYAILRVAGLLVLAFLLFLVYRTIVYLFLSSNKSEQEE